LALCSDPDRARARIFANAAKTTFRNYSLVVDLPWNPRDFLREQYGHLPKVPELGEVITLSGAAENIYAATSETYVRRMWPKYGPVVLAVFQNALDSSND
jgi:hypothetical protein